MAIFADLTIRISFVLYSSVMKMKVRVALTRITLIVKKTSRENIKERFRQGAENITSVQVVKEKKIRLCKISPVF